MGRPRKQTVDYFPHMVAHKRTMFVIEGKWGNDGYAFWFKLLEVLGSSEGHCFDCNRQGNWEFLQAKTRLSECRAKEILDTLAGLDAIDLELWNNKIIWSQNFVDGLMAVYENRRTKVPSKPNLVSTGSLQEKTPFLHEPLKGGLVETPLSTSRNPSNYRKKPSSYALEYSRVEEVEVVTETPTAAPPPATPPEVKSPPLKTKPKGASTGASTSASTKPKDKQLADLAKLLRIEDPEEYKKLLEVHPELASEEVPW